MIKPEIYIMEATGPWKIHWKTELQPAKILERPSFFPSVALNWGPPPSMPRNKSVLLTSFETLQFPQSISARDGHSQWLSHSLLILCGLGLQISQTTCARQRTRRKRIISRPVSANALSHVRFLLIYCSLSSYEGTTPIMASPTCNFPYIVASPSLEGQP